MSEKNLEEGSDYQIGAHDIDKTTSLSSDELIEFDYESAAVFKRLADDIYESAEAGIREPLQNGLTAVRRAIRQDYIDQDEGVVKIEVQDGEQVTVTLQDNGIGIERSVLEDVLAVIGRSQSRDDGDLSGKYGMGFLAFYKIVGVDGGFFMFTNSRETSATPVRGIWRPGGFEVDTEGELPRRFAEDEYGTRFEFTAKEGITVEQVREWVENHSKWARIPIIYEEYDKDGDINIEEEYGIQTLDDAHESADFPITINNNYYKCICSSVSRARTLLLNSPIGRNSNYKKWRRGGEAPRAFDIRLKNENGVIVKGPHEGMMPVSKSEYRNMDSSRQENYVPESELSLPKSDSDVMDDGIDIPMPKPTGTRDTLSKNKWFWSYLQKKIYEKAKSELENKINSIDKPEEFVELNGQDIKFIERGMRIMGVTGSTAGSIKSSMNNELGIVISDEMAEFYARLRDEVFVIDEGTRPAEAQRKNGSGVNKIQVSDIVADDTDNEYYMGVTMNETKMKAVWDSDAVVIRVPDSNYYEPLNSHFGWRELKDIRDFVDESDLRDSVQKSMFGSDDSESSGRSGQKPIEDRDITIHANTKKKNQTVGDIKDSFRTGDEKLILFPSNSDLKLSDYYEVVSENISIANCLVKMWDELKDISNIYRVEEWIDEVSSEEFETSEGVLTTKEIADSSDEYNIVLHPVRENYDVFTQSQILDEMDGIVSCDSIQDKYLDPLKESELVYVPLDSLSVDKIYSYIHHELENCSSIYTIYNGGRDDILGNQVKTPSNLYWYAWCRIPSWRGTDKLQALSSKSYELNSKWMSVVDEIAENGGNSYTSKLTDDRVFKTSHGYMTSKEMEENSDLIVAHINWSEAVQMFRDESVIYNMTEYIAENENPSFRNDPIKQKVNSLDDVLYVPVTKGEAIHISEIVSNANIHIVDGDKPSRQSDSSISSDTIAYASVRLSDDMFDLFVPSDGSRSVKKLTNGAYEIIEELAD